MKVGRVVILFSAALVFVMKTSLSFAQSTLNVKAFIEGYYVDNISQLHPIIDPVNSPLLFDTITVQLADASNGSIVFSSQQVFDVDGNTVVTVPPLFFGGYYFIVLKHRNSIETWSALPVLVTTVVNYDFTTGVTQAYGDNMAFRSGVSLVYSGDINQDGSVDGLDFLILNADIQLSPWGYYLVTDLNGDSAVDGLDFLFLDPNIQSGVHSSIPTFTSSNDVVQFVEESIIMYPNPAAQSVIIFSKRCKAQCSLYIYSSSGHLMKMISNYELGTPIVVQSFVNGIYTVKIIDKDHVYQQQLIVVN